MVGKTEAIGRAPWTLSQVVAVSAAAERRARLGKPLPGGR
jgi:hypothetical protein